MNSIRTLLSVLLLAALLPVGSAFAQDLPSSLAPAAQALEAGNPQRALDTADDYLQSNPRGRHALAAMLLAGRAELALDRADGAIDRGWRALNLAEADSPFRADAHYLLATAYQAAGDHAEAARQLVHALDAGPSTSLEETVFTRLTELIDGPAAYRANDLLLTARNEGTRRALRRIVPAAAETPTVGLLLPDAEAGWEHGEAFRAGLRAALDLWSQDGGEEIDLIERTLPDDPARAVHAARSMVRQDGIWALIAMGPADFVVPAMVEAQAAGVPVLLPGQGKPSLTGIGPSVVLPEADWRTEGRLAAKYATDILNLKTFGIVAPYTDRGRENVAGFLDVLSEKDDVDVLDQQWYRPEEGVSLATQFSTLRTKGFKREFLGQLIEQEYQLQDSLHAVIDSFGLGDVDSVGGRLIIPLNRDSIRIDSSRLEREWRRHLIKVRQTVEFKTGNIDSNAIELRAYDALYLPIEPGTIPIFAPQFAFYNFYAVRLGNSAWHDPDELLRHEEYVEALGFTSPLYLMANNDPLSRLSTRLNDASNQSVNAWTLRGHDAVRLLLLAMTGAELNDPAARSAEITHRGPRNMAVALRSLEHASLAAGRQTFTGNAPVGGGMWFLTVEDGAVDAMLDSLYTESMLDELARRYEDQRRRDEIMPDQTLPDDASGELPAEDE